MQTYDLRQGTYSNTDKQVGGTLQYKRKCDGGPRDDDKESG